MAKLQDQVISNRMLDRLTVKKDTVFWDRELMGFGVRVYPSGRKVYIAQVRGPDGSKRVTVGRHGIIGAKEARRRGALIIARIKAGEEPVRKPAAAKRTGGPTVAEATAMYMEEHVAVRCKPKTEQTVRYVAYKHLVPTFGPMPLAAVGREQVRNLHHRLCETPAQANAVIKTFSQIYRMAESRGLIPEGGNPCKHVVRYKGRRRERFLTDTEYDRLGQVLDEAAGRRGRSARAVAAIRLLMLTGCRCNEILSLRWEDVDLQAREMRLRDTKTGARVVSLAPAAVNVLAGLPRAPSATWVIPGNKPGAHIRKIQTTWERLRARAGLEDVRLHDLRHSFASRALALGENLPMIGKLLGHSQIETTARYAHLARGSVHESAARVADSIAADIL